MDYGFTESIPRYDVRRMCASGKAIIRKLESQQLNFDRLWAKQAVNEFNNVEYREFLKRYQLHKDDKLKQDEQTTQRPCDEIQPISNQISVPRPPSRLGTSDSHRLRGNPRPVTPLVNADSAEMKVKDLVYKSWQDIQRECKKLDLEGTGTVLPDEFVGILDSFGVILPLEDARQLMLKYDLHEQQGRFSYREFLRHFILTLKPQDDGLLKRRKIHAAKLPVDTGSENSSFFNAMIGLRERVLLSWKEMRRSFRNLDQKADGFVSPAVFRQDLKRPTFCLAVQRDIIRVLRQFSINLSEEDFYHLVSFYDHKMKGEIPYNDFIRAFLQ